MADFESRDPDVEARVLASFGRRGFMAHIGATHAIVEPGFCKIRLPYSPEVTARAEDPANR